MEKMDILKILRSDKTVFSFKDIFLASEEKDPALLRRKINYYVKIRELYHIRKGFYAKDSNYARFELAGKIYTPSYISLETVLGAAGVTFQYYGQIFAVSYLTREIIVDGQKYSYKKIKDSILTDTSGIGNKKNYFIASPERAFLDIIYLNKDYHFDNLSPLDWDKVYGILPIYGNNKRMRKTVGALYGADRSQTP
ncbi:hypothetical protein A2Y83_01385 [Candidatus Falkowbacteria bacterium RBG_13_39_14]|uniref:AbiEi antitoxin C-terminal domain-containing protein n=1 Tax=Candidatus Falkowbacteria bacterium RBG_13_39_14 TaxID=1797985 RepID=A0A1F5S9G3_9BACT|nr:MAG: hypothetical protein A2Y83_01385 [Candidatus Falkowbacteria bacterium RBG_13_39_14]